MVLFACEPVATPFEEAEFVPTESLAGAEASVATEPPADIPTEEPNLPGSNPADSVSEPTARSENGADSSSPSDANAEVIEMTIDNWAEVVDQSPVPVLLYFWAPSNEVSAALRHPHSSFLTREMKPRD